MSDQVATMLFSWAKVFASACLTVVLVALTQDQALQWQAVLVAGLVAVLPVIINWLDAGDPRYGRGYTGEQ
jgi:hypothetical protein